MQVLDEPTITQAGDLLRTRQEMRERFASVGAETIANTPAEFDRFLHDEIARWTKIINEVGIKLD